MPPRPRAVPQSRPSISLRHHGETDVDPDSSIHGGGEAQYWRALAELTQVVSNKLDQVSSRLEQVSSGLSELTRLQQSASDASSTGWGLLEKTVRGYDEDEIKSRTDNIDTLLLFAGLYAAILAAFSVVSLTFLKPDTGQQTVALLQQLVNGSSDFTSNPGRQSDATSDDDDFKPPGWAVRVNVLWFASLVISLSAASLGILVRQWLVESLARTYKSPQQLLRARQYRDPATRRWLVTHFADALPMLLEFALLLFFAGLCEFTAAFNPSVGHTTWPLVTGWGFLLFASFILPCFFPHCPYKTNFLYEVASFIRRELYAPTIKKLSRNANKTFIADIAEEADVVQWRSVADDVKLMLYADSIIPETGLVETILGIYEQTGPHKPVNTLKFSLTLLSHRIGLDFGRLIEAETLLHITQLSLPDWQHLTSLTANALASPDNFKDEEDDEDEHIDIRPFRHAAFRFLVSPTRHELSRAPAELISLCLSRNKYLVFKDVLVKLSDSGDLGLRERIGLILRLTGLALGVKLPTQELKKLLPLESLDHKCRVQVMRVTMEALRKTPESRSKAPPDGIRRRVRDQVEPVVDAMMVLLSGSPRALSPADKEVIQTLNVSTTGLSVVLTALDDSLPDTLDIGERAVLAARSLLSLYLPQMSLDADEIVSSLDLTNVPEVVQRLLIERLSETMEKEFTSITYTEAVPYWIKACLFLMVSVSDRLLKDREKRLIANALRSPSCLRFLLDRPIAHTTNHGFGDQVVSVVRILSHVGFDSLPRMGARRRLSRIPSPSEFGLHPETYRGLVTWIAERWDDWKNRHADKAEITQESWWAFDAVTFLLSNEPAYDLPLAANQLLRDFALSGRCLDSFFGALQYHPAERFAISAPNGAQDRVSWTQTIWAASRFMKAIRATSGEDRIALLPAWMTITGKLYNILPPHDPTCSSNNGNWTTTQQDAVCLLLSRLGPRPPPATEKLIRHFISDAHVRGAVLAALTNYRAFQEQPADLMWLALTLTRYILGRQSSIDSLDEVLDFGAVDEDLRESLAKLVADALAERHSSRVTQTPPWVIDAVIFLLSVQEGRPQIAGHDEGNKPPPPGVLALRDCFCGPATAIATGIRLRRSPFVPLAHKLLHVCETGIALKHALALYIPYLCDKVDNNKIDNAAHAHRSLIDVLENTDCETHLSKRERQRVSEDIRNLLENSAKRTHLPSGAWPDVSVEVIVTLGQLALFAPRSVTIRIFTSMWQDPDSFGLFWFFAGLHEQDRLDEKSEAGRLCKEVLAQADTHEVTKCLEQSCRRLKALLDGQKYGHQLLGLGPLDYVRLCRLCLRAYQDAVSLMASSRASTSNGHAVPPDANASSWWTHLWTLLAKLVAKYDKDKGWNGLPRDSTNEKIEQTKRPQRISLRSTLQSAEAVSPQLHLLQQDIAIAGECISMIDVLEACGIDFPDELRVALEDFSSHPLSQDS